MEKTPTDVISETLVGKMDYYGTREAAEEIMKALYDYQYVVIDVSAKCYECNEPLMGSYCGKCCEERD